MDRVNGVTESVLHSGQMAHTTAQAVQGHARTLNGHILALQGVTSGSWADAMQSANMDWQQGAARLINALGQHGDGLNFTANTYEAANDASRHGFMAALGASPITT
ncbi:WXG100 family type VII secretion target [Fodinicola acaciae]|uniref:WXG100 family type VII secretion target n=1 Tax=Fodinicola acaciae TaxID=2681555 RepID=UPI0013CF8D18|nr:WXG100 family type VII secretion target [Fodinicola acaciae]